jgi:hypothetical protein
LILVFLVALLHGHCWLTPDPGFFFFDILACMNTLKAVHTVHFLDIMSLFDQQNGY